MSISFSETSDLERLCTVLPAIPSDPVRTFRGRKGSFGGSTAAFFGMLGTIARARTFARILTARSPGVMICTFQSIWDLAALPVLRKTAGRCILILHDAAFRSGDRYPLRSAILRWQVAEADALIVLTDQVGRDAQRVFKFPTDRIWTVPHGQFVFGNQDARARTLPAFRRIRLLFLGRIVAYKGLVLLLEAYTTLRAQGAPVDLAIVGDGDLGPYRNALAKAEGVTIVNHWLDDQEIAGALRRADIVVLPYVAASQSGIAAAAFAAALPVVATPVGGLTEQIRDRETGILADAVTAVALADAIVTLVHDPELYSRCSAGALRHARDDLSWSRVAARVAAIAADVAQRPKRGAMP
ncbi:glycosyltransferase family 4 protein [Beijerinckia sp. L45]|uniref:glycosyltransferase family 4 protein n=1 Tax=Beijerinckia sp. L45 TaxID=1641855 RepID=UPI001FEE97F8